MIADTVAKVHPSILVVTELFPSLAAPFVGSFVQQQLQALAGRYRIVVAVPRCSPPWQPVAVPPAVLTAVYTWREFSYRFAVLRRFGLRSLPSLDRSRKVRLRRHLVTMAQRLHRRYHFSLVHGHEAFVGDEAVTVGQALGLPTVVTIHGLYPQHRNHWGQPALDVVVRNLNRASRLLAVSPLAAESYRLGGVPQPWRIIPNVMPAWVDRPAPPLPQPWRGLVAGRTVILGVGFFVPEKRFERLLETAAKLRPRYGDTFAVLLVGCGPRERCYRQLIRERGLVGLAHVVGVVPPAAMASFYAACHLLVHPSVVESFSMVCLEAMAMGKPFVCTEGIGMTEYLRGSEGIVVAPDDQEALVGAVDRLLADPALRHAMGERGRQTAQQFHPTRVAPQIAAVYDELIAAG